MSRTAFSRKFDVFIGERPRFVGNLVFEARGSREASSFAYAQSWIDAPDAIALAPSLPLLEGRQFARKAEGDRHSTAFHSVFADALPDAWGRAIVKLNARRAAGGSLISDVDYLQGVDDPLRFGAIRFRDEKGVFVRAPGHDPVAPAIVNIERLLAAADAIGRNAPNDSALQALIGPGSSTSGRCSTGSPALPAPTPISTRPSA